MKEHKLETVEDIAALITRENYQNMMLDIANCFYFYLEAKEITPDVKLKAILWKDDRNVGLSGISFVDKDGKQIKRNKFK